MKTEGSRTVLPVVAMSAMLLMNSKNCVAWTIEYGIGRRDHPYIDTPRDILADTFVLALLQHAQQLRLQFERQIADLVEEERPPMCDLKAPEPIAHRTRESAPRMPEEFALEHLSRDRAAVHPDERPLRTPPTRVNPLREQLLARAGFSGDQHRRIRRRHIVDLFQHPSKRNAPSDDPPEREDAFVIVVRTRRVELEPWPQSFEWRRHSRMLDR
jgi:hypothetical protein